VSDAQGAEWEERVRERRALVDAALAEVLPPAGSPPYDAAGAQRVTGEDDVPAAMRYTTLAGGKRYRPILALVTFEALAVGEVPVRPDRALWRTASRPCLALELVHASALILDDLPCMDDASERRGRPANHIVFGESMAILAAVGLLATAYGLLADTAGTLPARTATSFVSEMTEAIGVVGLIGGQALDLRLQRADTDRTSAAPARATPAVNVETVHARKTGTLFRAAARLGGRLAGVSTEHIEALGRFGECVGVAYQIVDDLHDIIVDPGGAPARGHSANVARMYGEPHARRSAETWTSKAAGHLGSLRTGAPALASFARHLAARTE
jgi:geranylgeranyl diphosphate synthase type II